MSGWIALLSSFAIFATCQPYSARVEHLRIFYGETAKKMSGLMHQLVAYSLIKSTEYGIVSLKDTLFHYQQELVAIRELTYTNLEFCQSFDLYKRATVWVDEILNLRYALEEERDIIQNLDETYAVWLAKCPVYQVVPKEERISLYYYPDDVYVRHAKLYDWYCCQFTAMAEDEFWLQPLGGQEEFITYGDTIALGWYDSMDREERFLTNEMPLLKWKATKIDSWEKWRIESFCGGDIDGDNYKHYGVLHYCDMIQFHSMDGENHYFSRAEGYGSHRTKTRGNEHFVVFPPHGHFPL